MERSRQLTVMRIALSLLTLGAVIYLVACGAPTNYNTIYDEPRLRFTVIEPESQEFNCFIIIDNAQGGSVIESGCEKK